MTNNDLAVELLQQRKKKREDPQSAATQTSTQNMSGQAALAQELLSQRIQARKEREATQPTVSLPSQRIDPAKERQESKGKFNGWKYFGNLGKTLLAGAASISAATGAMAEDAVTSVIDTIFQGANTKGSGLFNALYHGRPEWKFLGENGLVGIEQNKAHLDAEREEEVSKINDSTIAGKAAKKAASYGGDIAYGVGGAIPMAMTAGAAAVAPIVNGVATSTEALANLGASVVESSGVLSTLGKGFRDTLTSKNYWTAFASEVGSDYQEALSDGASTSEAMNYAIATSLLNSVIEIGGGIQNVPKGFSVKNLLRSAAEEGIEEIWQGPVGRTMQNVVYGADNPIASLSDDRAIFNPVTSAQEFAGGFAVGGILSGAQMAAGKAAGSVYNKQIEKQSKRYEQAQQMVRDRSGVKGTYQTQEDGKTTVGGSESAIKSIVKGGQIEMENGEVVSPEKVTFADRNTADLYEGAINRAANAGAANVFVDSYAGGDVSRYLLGMQEAYEDGRAGVVTEKRGTFADDLTDAQRTAAWNQGAADGLQSFRSDTGLGENGSAAWTQVQQNQAVKSNPRLRTGFTSMYQAGLSGKALTDVKSDAAKYIPPSVQTAAYQAGLADAASSLAREKAGVKLVTRSNESGLADNDYSRNLANKDAGTARVLGALASDMGVRIEIVPQVQGGAANGKYVSKTNTIQLAADADNPLAFVAAHEVTHRMQDAAPTEYHAYRDAVMAYRANELGDDTAAHMVERYRDASREAGVTLTQEEAMDEIAADFTAKMIDDANLFERFARQNRTEAKTLLDRLKEFISKVKNLVASKRNKAAQEAYGKNFAELQKIAALWQTAYDKAAETVGHAVLVTNDAPTAGVSYDDAVYSLRVTDEALKNGDVASIPPSISPKSTPVRSTEILTDSAVVTADDGERYSLKSMKRDIAEGQMFEDLKSYCNWTQAQVDELKTNIEGLVRYMEPHRDILDMNETTGRDDRRFSPYKQNSDPLYKISMDFSTLCSKRLLTQYVIESLQVREGRPMSAEEQMAIRDMLIEYRKVDKGLQVACAMCYVEAARLKSPKQMQTWLDDRGRAMRKYYAAKNQAYEDSIIKAQEDFKESRGYDRDTPKSKMKHSDVTELNKIRPRMASEYQPTDSEQRVIDQVESLPTETFLTSANLAQFSEDLPDGYAAYIGMMTKATHSKPLETDEAYYYGDSRRKIGHGKVVTDRFLANMNRENGMRFSSWSDWRIQHLLDYITAVIDNSVRGAKMHGYTKYPDEVRVLGKTGMMFNLSGVAGTQTGLNPDGSLSFSDTESINIEEAKALREEFPDTAGLQCIGVSDKHIRALMRSEDVDYIIPYHTSSLNKDLRRMAQIHGWKDYTLTQNEKKLKGATSDGSETWQVTPAFSDWFVGYDTGMSGIEAMRASAARYLEICKERGLRPKFEAFTDEPNYWKLLIDRKMINQETGKLIRQKPVTPEFDFDTIRGIVDRYVEDYDSSREERALKYVTDNWDTIPQRIKYLKATEAQKKAMATLGNEMIAAQPKENRLQLKSQTQIESEMRDIKKERDRLKARVKSLERQVARWKAEVKPSMPSFREGDLKNLGNRLINDFDSSTKYSEIKTDMENLGKALLSQDVPDTDLHAYAEYVAKKIIQNSRVLEEGGEDLLEIQKHLKSVKLAYTDDGSIPDFSEWKKAHRDIKFAKDGGLPVDVAYHELTELFGSGYFPENIVHPADQLTRMGEVLEDIDNIWSNPYDEYRDIAVTALGNALIEGMISDDVRQTRPTYADRKEQEIAHLKDLLSKTRAGRDEKIKQMRTAYAERTKAGAERRKAREIRAKISRHTETLSRKLLRPTDKQHIPESLRMPVAKLLRSINLESSRSYDAEGNLQVHKSGKRKGEVIRRTQDAIRLREAYNEILKSDPNFVVDPALFGEDGQSGFIDQLVALGDQRIDKMGTEQLNIIWKAIKGIETTITSYDKALSSGKYMFISQWANDLRSGVSSRKRANKKAALSLYDPRTFFNAYGDAGLDVFRALRNAEDTKNRRVAEVAKLTEKFMSREVYKQRNERHTFMTEAGQTITLTNDQIMNLYNLANRGKHSMQHLSVGGVIQPYIKRDGKLPAIERGTKSIPLTANDVAQITDVLTDEQIKVAKGLQKIASTMLAKWGNEASMAVYGYNKFTEEHYWPIKSAREAIVQNAERGENMPREIRNMGSAKALNENASNTLDLGGVFDVFTKNASDMITYSTMLEPMEDINRLFNYRYRDSAGNLTGKNVKNVLTDVYGEQALKYWRNLMSDVQNGIAHDDEPITRMIEKFVGRTKAASVGMNARVVLQQPTAFFRAAAILDPSDMAKGLVKAPTKGNGWKKAKQYAGIAAIKDSSGFDQAGQYTIMKGILNGADQTFMDKLSDASGAAAAKADAVTWGKIWNACEYTVQKEGRYEVGSEDFYTRTAEVFSDVIDQSQVVDGILQRTQIMRSGNGLTKQATAFMGEPMKSLNMLLRAYDAWRYETNPSKKSAALKQFARTSIALLVTDGVNALVQSLVDAARKDDKDKDYWGRYFEVLTGVTGEDDTVVSVLLGSNLWDNIDPVGRIPFAKDIKSMLQGYTVSRMDADAVSDFIAAAQLFTKATQGDGQKTTLYAFKQLLVTGSKIFGISVGNIGRDTWAVARSIAQETGSYWAMYQMEQMIYRVAPDAKNSSRYYSILYHALQDDKAAYDRIYADLISKGYTDKQIKTGMKNAIKNAGGSDMLSQLEDVGFSREDAETVIKQQEFKQSYGFSYDDLADEYADGNISRRGVIRALQNVGGLSAEDAELRATAYDWKNAGVSDATNAIVKAYQSYGSDAGFDKKSFAEAYKDLNAVKGEDTDGDGKIEKKQFVLEAINKMNISTAQKDALYRMKGYGEKQLADAPWH
nr:MAG TPA: hypothetical protein [Caudoviricetes sp.]